MKAKPLIFGIAAASLGSMTLSAQSTWTGGGTLATPAQWSLGSNWSANPPASETSISLLFNNTAANSWSNNDLTGLIVSSISIPASVNSVSVKDNTITGNSITLTGDVSVGTGNFQTINLGMGLTGIRTFTVSSGQLTLGGNLVDVNAQPVGGITKSGGAALVLSGSNSYTGETLLSEGSLFVNHNNALGSTVAGTRVIGITAGSGAGRSIYLKNGITVTGETLTLSTASGTRASLFTNDTNGVSAWNGNVSISGGGQAAFWVENTSRMTVGASSTNTITGDGSTSLNLRGSSSPGTGIVNSSINLGGGNLVKNDGAFWTLTGTNTNIGTYTVAGTGTLQLAKTASLFGGDTASWTAAKMIVQNNSTLAFNVGGTGEFTTGNITTLLTNLASSSSSSNGMNSGSRFGFDTTNASGGSFTIADVLANSSGTSGGARGVTKLGTNSLILTNTNTYTGATTISSGTLQLGSGGSTGSLSASSSVTNNGTLAINRSNTVTQGTDFNSTVSGSGSFVKSGAGNLILSGANISSGTSREALTFSGANSGTVTLNNSAALGAAGNSIRFSGGGSGVLDLRTNGTLNAYNIASGTGNGGTIIANRNSLDVNNPNVSYTLGSLDLSSVTLTINKGGNVTGSAAVSFTELKMTGGNNNNPVTLAGDVDITLGSASITSTGISKRLQLDGTSSNNVVTGVISDTNNSTTGAVVNLIKANSSTWTLQSNNTYTGSTTIKGGTLKINSSTAIGSSSAITVGDAGSSNAILDATTGGFALGASQTLGGIGKIVATGQTITASGTIAPGNSVGTIQIDGGTLALDSSSKFNFELGTTSDLISLLNLATLNLGEGVIGLSDFTFSDAGGFGAGTYNLISGANSFSGSLDPSNLTGQVLGLNSTLSMSGNNLVLTVIPEPKAALLGSLGLLALLRRRRND
jgi:autotransporter-associated beta strand protein